MWLFYDLSFLLKRSYEDLIKTETHKIYYSNRDQEMFKLREVFLPKTMIIHFSGIKM